MNQQAAASKPINQGFVTGNDFWGSPQSPQMTWALRAAKKAHLKLMTESFVTGHDFSRADKAHRMTWALELIRRLGLEVANHVR
jgi:hypothetical protein